MNSSLGVKQGAKEERLGHYFSVDLDCNKVGHIDRNFQYKCILNMFSIKKSLFKYQPATYMNH